MIVLQILGWIFAILVLLLILIGSIKLSVRVGYAAQGPLLTVRIAWFTFRLADGKPKLKKAKAPQKDKKTPEHAQKKQKKPKKEPKPYTGEPVRLTEVLTAWRDVAIGLCKQLGLHLKIELLRLRVLVATEDAAKTALLYGTVCGLVQPVQLLAQSAPRVNKKQVTVSVNCDFLAETPELDAELLLSTRVWRMGWIALRSAKPLLNAFRLLKGYQAKNKEEKPDDTP